MSYLGVPKARSPRPSVLPRRISPFRCGVGSPATSRSASSTPSAQPWAYSHSHALARKPTPALAGRGRRGARRGSVGALLVRQVRGRLAAALLRPLSRVGRCRPRRRDHDPRVHRVRFLQPLVAVRLDAGHVGRASRRDVRRHRVLPRLRGARLPSREVPRGIWIVDFLLLLAFVMGVRLLARTLIERPAARSIVARGEEVLIVGAGDAAQLILREMLRNPSLGLHPDRARRRRPAEEEPAAPRNPGPRDDRRAPRAPP